MAELLIRAKKHWKDELNATLITKMNAEEKMQYDARCQIGDIIVVKPDGWKWGKEEGLPVFVIKKYPGIKAEELKHLESPLFNDIEKPVPLMLKYRRYSYPKLDITTMVINGTPSIIAPKSEIQTKIIDKSIIGTI